MFIFSLFLLFFFLFSSRFAFVAFTSEEDAKKALEATSGKDFNGKKLNVDYAFVRSENQKNADKKKKEPEAKKQKTENGEAKAVVAKKEVTKAEAKKLAASAVVAKKEESKVANTPVTTKANLNTAPDTNGKQANGKR